MRMTKEGKDNLIKRAHSQEHKCKICDSKRFDVKYIEEWGEIKTVLFHCNECGEIEKYPAWIYQI